MSPFTGTRISDVHPILWTEYPHTVVVQQEIGKGKIRTDRRKIMDTVREVRNLNQQEEISRDFQNLQNNNVYQ